MSRGESETMGAIGDEMAVDDLRQLAFEAAQRFARGLVLGELAIVVVPPGARVHGIVATGTSKIGDGSVEMIRMLKIARERHRLNRGGDRQANAALHRVVVVRLR